HPIVTGAIAEPDLIVHKVEQPEAVAPNPELLDASDLPLPPAVQEKPVVARREAKPATAPAPAREPVKRAAQARATPAAKSPASAVWVVQLSSQRDETTAWSAWKKLQSSTGGLLAKHTAAVVRADLGAKGVYFRLQVGLETKRDAQDLCGRLKARGASCLVSSRQ